MPADGFRSLPAGAVAPRAHAVCPRGRIPPAAPSWGCSFWTCRIQFYQRGWLLPAGRPTGGSAADLGVCPTGGNRALVGQAPWTAGDPLVAPAALDHRYSLASLTSPARTGFPSM